MAVTHKTVKIVSIPATQNGVPFTVELKEVEDGVIQIDINNNTWRVDKADLGEAMQLLAAAG